METPARTPVTKTLWEMIRGKSFKAFKESLWQEVPLFFPFVWVGWMGGGLIRALNILAVSFIMLWWHFVLLPLYQGLHYGMVQLMLSWWKNHVIISWRRRRRRTVAADSEMAFPALTDKDAALTHKTENEPFGSEAGHGVRTRKLTRKWNVKKQERFHQNRSELKTPTVRRIHWRNRYNLISRCLLKVADSTAGWIS